MTCEKCIKHDELERMKDDIKELKTKYDNLFELDKQRAIDQATITTTLSNIDTKLDNFINNEFTKFVEEFKKNSKKPEQEWDTIRIAAIVSAVTGLISFALGKFLR